MSLRWIGLMFLFAQIRGYHHLNEFGFLPIFCQFLMWLSGLYKVFFLSYILDTSFRFEAKFLCQKLCEIVKSVLCEYWHIVSLFLF